MISSPVGPAPLSALQGNCVITGGPWWWNGAQYQMASGIESGKGYWISVDSPCTMEASGSSSPVGLGLFAGWNMISSAGSWNQTNTDGCNLFSGPWRWDGIQYQSIPLDTPMDSFKGYWVKVDGNCSVSGQGLRPSSWQDSLLPPGPPVTSSGGPLASLLQLLGISPQTAGPQASAMPFTLEALRVISANAGEIEVQIQGSRILSSTMDLYDLSGQLVAEAEGTGNLLRFSPLDSAGQPLANGVYLYAVTVRGAGGEVVQSGLRKLMLLH